MIGRRTVVGLAVLCALALSAISVSSAMAAQAQTCTSSAGTIDKFGAHCLAVPAEKTANFGHKSFTGTTELSGSNEKTASETTTAAVSVLASSISGVATELQCTGVSGTGSMANGASQAEGSGVITYSGCTVLKPAGKSCVVKGGSVTTETLKAASLSATELKFSPNSGETFTNITIEKCTTEALNATYPVTGSLVGTVSGATTSSTEAGVTTQNTLKFGGQKAGLGGSITISGRSGGSGAFTPLVLT